MESTSYRIHLKSDLSKLSNYIGKWYDNDDHIKRLLSLCVKIVSAGIKLPKIYIFSRKAENCNKDATLPSFASKFAS